MMEKILTISIAAYNVENYIRETLNSLIDEDIIDDLEIFVVDDGGTDSTLEIVQEYADRYPQSIFPVHKENGGYGSTINKSIELATGKYFKQLDGDDWYDTGNLKNLINVLKKVSVDCVLTDFIVYNENTGEYNYRNLYPYLREGRYELDQSGLKDRLSMYATAFRTELLQSIPDRLSEHCFYTDIEYVALPIPYIDSIYVLHKAIYMYRTGVEGQSMNASGIAKHYKEHERVFWKLLEVYRTIPEGKPINKKVFRYLLINRMYEHYKFLCILPISSINKQELRRFTNQAKKMCPDILQNAINTYKTVHALILTRFLAYPAISVWIKMKWNRESGHRISKIS